MTAANRKRHRRIKQAKRQALVKQAAEIGRKTMSGLVNETVKHLGEGVTPETCAWSLAQHLLTTADSLEAIEVLAVCVATKQAEADGKPIPSFRDSWENLRTWQTSPKALSMQVADGILRFAMAERGESLDSYVASKLEKASENTGMYL